MRRPWIAAALVTSLAATAAIGIGLAANASSQKAPEKVTICHKTASGAFQRITVSSRAWTKPSSAAGKTMRAHMGHIGDALVIGNAACPSSSATPAANDQTPTKVTICHKTGSQKNPYRRITVSSRAVTNPNSQSGNTLRGHAGHEGDILIPGATPCPSGPSGGGTNQSVRLTANLQPVSGANGSGSATVTIRVPKSELCFTLSVSNLGSPVTAAHIHLGSTGAIVVPLTAPTSGSSSGCVTVAKALLREIVASPGAYYINVHTDAFPNGQVRGDLSK
jgi:hypothetical protein